MKKMLLLTGLLASLTGFGQTHLVGVQGGANISGYDPFLVDFNRELGPRTGIAAGITYNYLSKKHFWLGADLLFQQRGFYGKNVISYQFPNATGEERSSDTLYTYNHNFSYMALPLKAGVQFGKKGWFFANVGVMPALLLSAKIKAPVFGENNLYLGRKTTSVTNGLNRFDLAGMAEIGGGYKIQSRYWLYGAMAFQQSFTAVNESTYFTTTKSRNTSVSFSIGLKMALQKKMPAGNTEN